jgi:hypothetical protein
VFQLHYRPYNVDGRAIARAVSHRLVTAEASIRFQVGPCRIYVRQSGTQAGFSRNILDYRRFYHSTSASYSFICNRHRAISNNTRPEREKERASETDRDNSLLVLQFISTGVVLEGY